jgi:hypothetical protein
VFDDTVWKRDMAGLLNQTQAAQQSVTRILKIIAMNLVTPKAAAKLELLFNNPAPWKKEVVKRKTKTV